MMGEEGKAQPAESDSKACETDTSGLHQSLWCELIKLPNSAFSGVRAVVMNSLERQCTFEQDTLLSLQCGKFVKCVCYRVTLKENMILC